MNEQQKENLSALFDNELNAQEAEALLQQLQQSPELKAQWQGYQTIQNTMKRLAARYDHSSANQDLLVSIQQKLVREPRILAPQRKQTWYSSAMVKPLANLAMAASVSAVVIGVGQWWQAEQTGFKLPVLSQSESGTVRHKTAPINGALATYPRAPESGNLALTSRQEKSQKRLARLSQEQRLKTYVDKYLAHKETAVSQTPGLLTVTIEPLAASAAKEEGITRIGDTLALERVLPAKQSYYKVTVVGNVPVETAERVATSIRLE